MCVNYDPSASFPDTVNTAYLVTWRSRDFPQLWVIRTHVCPPCPVKCLGVPPLTVAENRPEHLVFVVFALIENDDAVHITAETSGIVKCCFLLFRSGASPVPYVENLEYAQTIAKART